jgi:ATP-binding cassette, subfamily B, multidrug efflux pump
VFSLFKYLKPLWWKMLLSVFLISFQAFFQLELPKQMGILTNLVLANSPSIEIIKIGIWMLIVAFLVVILAVSANLFNTHIAATFAKTIRHEIFIKVNSFSLTEFEQFGTTSLMTRTTNDVVQIQMIIQMGMRFVIMSPVIFVIALTNTLTSNPFLAIVFAVSIPLIIIAIVTIFVIASPLFTKIQAKIDRATLVLRESLTGVRVIRAFNQQKREAKRFDDANVDMTNLTIKVGKTMSFINPMINVVLNLTYLAIFFVGFASFNGRPEASILQLGGVLATAQYSMQIMFSLVMLAVIFIMFPRAHASAKRINAVLRIHSTITDPHDIKTPSTNTGQIEFRDVYFQFKDAESPTLKNISFTSRPGEVTAIIGSTGSGKSSIINLIPRFYDVTDGAIYINEVDIRDYSQLNLRSRIGFVPQQALLFSGSLRDNLRYGNTNATDEELWEALEVAQAIHFVKNKEGGLDFEVSQGGKNFSGGQKQRLAIARALVKKPEIYIFDDAFSSLDFKTDIRLRQALKNYIKGSTLIVVAQRVASIMDADNIIVVDEGQIVGQGKHNKLLKTCAVYREIVYSQLDPEEIDRTLELESQVLKTEGST